MLLNQLKEHVLHCSLTPEDNLFYFTTCGWMMWNWLVAGVDASVHHVVRREPDVPRPKRLWRWAEEAGVTVFGTSLKYLAALSKWMPFPTRRQTLPRFV